MSPLGAFLHFISVGLLRVHDEAFKDEFFFCFSAGIPTIHVRCILRTVSSHVATKSSSVRSTGLHPLPSFPRSVFINVWVG